jgi:regulator of sigma E protease
MTYILVILILAMLILIHELGHLVAAKCAKIPVARFSVGFGPKLWGWKSNETEYWLALVPLGGYVLPHIDDERELSDYSLFQRVVLCLGGPVANILAALVCLSIATAAGSGINLSSVLVEPLLHSYRIGHQIVLAIPTLFYHPEKLSGVVGIVALGGHNAGADFSRLLMFSVLLNINLAILNMLPIPPLDGGKIVFYLLETIWKPLKRLQVPVTIGGWALIMGIMIYATVMDIQHLIGRAAS